MFVLEKESLDKPCYLEPDDHTNSQVAVFFFQLDDSKLYEKCIRFWVIGKVW